MGGETIIKVKSRYRKSKLVGRGCAGLLFVTSVQADGMQCGNCCGAGAVHCPDKSGEEIDRLVSKHIVDSKIYQS